MKANQKKELSSTPSMAWHLETKPIKPTTKAAVAQKHCLLKTHDFIEHAISM